jgi:hypothetical protein
MKNETKVKSEGGHAENEVRLPTEENVCRLMGPVMQQL